VRPAPTEPCSTLFSALKGKEGGNKATGTAASPAPPTGSAAAPAGTADAAAPQTSAALPASDAAAAAATAAAAPASPAGTAPAPAPAAGTVAEPQNQPVLSAVAPTEEKKCTKKSDRPGRGDNELGPSQETEPEIIARSLSLSELRDLWKDFSCHPGEHIVTWLLRCWDNGAGSWESEGREAKQLGSLARAGGIDKAVGKKEQALSLWRRLLSGVRERYPSGRVW